MRALLLLLAALGLAACAGVDNTEQPAPLPKFEPTLEVRKDWIRFATDGTVGQFRQLTPYLEDDRIFVADAGGYVAAYAADSGKRLWGESTGLDLISGVSGGEGLIVVGARSGEAVALRQENGQELWRRRLSSEVMAFSRIELGVVVARTNDGKLHALSGASGELIWQAGRKTPALSLRGASAPVIAGGQLVVGFDTGKLALLALDRGNVLWEAPVAVPTGRSELERLVDLDGRLAVDGGEIFAASYQGRVAALGQRDGRIRWARDISSYAGLVLDAKHLYVTDELGAVWCLDRESGVALWRQDALRLRSVTAPVLLGDYVLVGDYQGYVHWLSRFDGRFLARVQVDDAGLLAAPRVRGDQVIALGNSGLLVGLRANERTESAEP